MVMVPSYSESFGLVAVEAQACGTPVVAAAVGGLRTAVRDGVSGMLVDSRDPARYARAVRDLIAGPAELARLSPRRPRARLPVRLVRDRGPAARPVRCVMSAGRRPRWTRERRRLADAAAARGRPALRSLGAWTSTSSPRSRAPTWSGCEGEHKLATMTWLIAGTHSLHVEAFFCRQPDENHAEFYRFLLERGSRMYGVHFALDPVGDVYLVGRLPLAAIAPEEIDRLLGCVLSYSDENFDQALMLGFASAIRKEYAWRVKRGESLANLRAVRPADRGRDRGTDRARD